MTMHFSNIAEQALADGTICADDVLALRRAGWANGQIDPDQAEIIFAINHKLDHPGTEWADFFVEAIGEYVVNQLEPRGYITDDNAEWLIARIEHDGRLHAMTELELLVRIFEKALNVPETLRAYALRQVEEAIVSGVGPTRCGGQLEKGNVTEAEARIMRRILFASGSERPAGVSRREAELLFRIKDETLGGDNAPEWKRLFVQGVGNYLQGFTAHTPLSRDRAAQLESFMNDHTSSVGAFMTRVVRSVGSPNRVGAVFGRKQVEVRIETLVASAREVTRDEKTWLDDRIEANGMVDEYDEALLAFLAEEGFAG
ncbi:hypothetical protein [Novosphingobium mangrovi (ex Huang et al. 2023)]|uniref:DUF4375 domain-containing protein n=1 Tax=Novosphingobium mangrovi (ex Huang et al. 2023) TaxID=2976432 RepID=A0ABT2I920_9SPHN|nr:hypothetical protein [Novosphingobium mangrovi (ex Huang et al. 2023)]MCT2401330.1 hypothetical protein [Novosphingobium mangrovi (ex Huang et al. 2023)]